MEALLTALICNNAGTRALHMSNDGSALAELTRSMHFMRESMVQLAEEGFEPSLASDMVSDDGGSISGLFRCRNQNQRKSIFILRKLPGMKRYSKHFLCAESIGLTEYGVHRMMSEWQDTHICSAIVTFNVALLYHQQGLVANSEAAIRSWLQKSTKMYKMAHSLLYNSDLASSAIRRIAWRIKLSTINNLSQIHLLGGKHEISRRGYEHLERIINVAQREVSRHVLGGATYDALLRNAIHYSLRIVVAPAA